ncbi:type III-A CRISPR-associated protein Cas10/Csm1 [candidate division KSB1 bacterium]
MQNKNPEISLNEVVLGALLHDIGKFMQRAEVPLSQQSQNMENVICPSFKGRHSHKHVLWTNEFFESYLANVPEGVNKSAAANLACYHHSPDDDMQRIVTKADHYSSGERIEKEYEEEAAGRYPYKKRRMISIFSTVNPNWNGEKNNHHEPEHRIDLKPLSMLKDDIFPKKRDDLIPAESESLVGSYKNLWEGFREELKNLPNDNTDLYLLSLQSLLEKYTWCIPSSTMDQPDISLYDHCRTTAAIAVCLFHYHSHNNTLNSKAIENDTIEKFALVGGDVSGIQKFIFDIAFSGAKGAGKMLRARSFYVDMVSRASIIKILNALELPLICNIMDAGGRFFLLVPNSEATLEKLTEVSNEIALWFKEEFLGELSLNLSWSNKLKGQDFTIPEFSRVMESISHEIDKQKQIRLKQALTDNNQWAPESFCLDSFYNRFKDRACTSCGKRPFTESEMIEGEEHHLCEQCSNLRSIGENIPRMHLLGYSKSEIKGGKQIAQIFAGSHEPVFIYHFDKLPDKRDSFILLEHIDTPDPGDEVIVPVRYMAHHVPVFSGDEEEKLCQQCELDPDSCGVDRKKGRVKTFTCIAAEDRTLSSDNGKYTGRQMVALLKADIDNLGLLVRCGLGKTLSISRYSSFSRMLNMFFTGYMQNLCTNAVNHPVYTVYSGGDDLFLVGPWESMIYFAEKLNNDFREYTCMNSDIHLSAALLPIRSRFPIRMAVRFAEESLEHAKHSGKNRLRLFNTTVTWNEFPNFRQFAEWLVERMRSKDKKIPSALVYRLLRYHTMAVRALKGDEQGKKHIEDLKFHSHMSYDIKRNVQREEDIRQLMKLYDLAEIDESLMMGLKIPIFWALYKQRGGK